MCSLKPLFSETPGLCYLYFDNVPFSCGYDKKQMCFEEKRRIGKRAEEHRKAGERDTG